MGFSFATGTLDVMRGGEDLFGATRLGDDLIISTMSSRSLQRPGWCDGSGEFRQGHVVIRTRGTRDEPRTQQPVGDLHHGAVLMANSPVPF